MRTVLTFMLLVGAAALCGQTAAQDQKDYKDIDLTKHGIRAVKESKDAKTGFLVGGKNTTAVIRGLTHINDIKVPDLERVMRPKKLSQAGFLGPDEKLLDILAADNDYVVGKLGLTHQELARHLHAMGALAASLRKRFDDRVEILYHGRRYQVVREDTKGLQDSPFEDGTKSGSNVSVKNLTNGKEIRYGLLVPYMVDRYGFYEGKGTSYRVEPARVVEVFDFVVKKKS
jgi:hypothetical protein